MLDKSIRKKREELKLESIRLRELLYENYYLDFKLLKEQDEKYKRWLFYDRFIKSMEEVQ